MRATSDGVQCTACGMFVLGVEPRFVMDHLAFQHTSDIMKILARAQ